MKKILKMSLFAFLAFFTMKHVYAADPEVLVREIVDYRFYVENEEGKDVGNLEFTIHDKNNVFSYTSTYDSTNKYYSFTANTFPNNPDVQYSTTKLPNIFTEEEVAAMSNKQFDGVFNTEVYNFTYGTYNSYYKFIPMILEQTGGDNSKTEAIKKTIYGIVHVMPGPDASQTRYDIIIQLTNHNTEDIATPFTSFSFPTPTDSSMIMTLQPDYNEPQIMGIKKHIVSYNSAAPSVLNFEDIGESEYLNRAVSVVKESGESYTNNKKRTSTNNIEDGLAVQEKSLPVIVKLNLPADIINPQTSNNINLIIAILFVTGCGLFILNKYNKLKKSSLV